MGIFINIEVSCGYLHSGRLVWVSYKVQLWSAPSLSKAIMEGARRKGFLLFYLGTAFKLRLYCCPLPILYCSYGSVYSASLILIHQLDFLPFPWT